MMMTTERAILAGGCFWGMEDLIRKLPGVMDTTVGYTGGHVPNPTYDLMKATETGHAEAIEITFDSSRLPYRALLEVFFQLHDPTTRNRQGNDRGTAYRSAIFYLDEVQRQTAEALISEMEASGKWPGTIVTELTPASIFYVAETYHQDYLQRYPDGYTCHYFRPTWRL
jgi:peptide-methionine (S)-S-oxide reductase